MEWSSRDFNADSAHQFTTNFSNIGLEQADGLQLWVRKYMAKILLRKILPFIGHWTLNVTDEALLPVSMNNFYALNYLLAIHFFPLRDLGSASDWLKENSLSAQPIRITTKIWVVHVISVEFLRLLLRRRFARAQVATSRNVGCFLRLSIFQKCIFIGDGRI